MIEDIPIGRLLVASMCPVPVISAVEGVERRSRARIRCLTHTRSMKKATMSVDETWQSVMIPYHGQSADAFRGDTGVDFKRSRSRVCQASRSADILQGCASPYGGWSMAIIESRNVDDT